MTPNSTIYTSFCTALEAANLGYAIAYPGLDFTPPTGAFWLEVNYLPNDGIQDGLSNNSTTIEQGIFQVNAMGRKGSGAGRGMIPTQRVAEELQAAFPKGTLISGLVRVSRTPYQMSPIQEGDKIMVPVTIPYTR